MATLLIDRPGLAYAPELMNPKALRLRLEGYQARGLVQRLFGNIPSQTFFQERQPSSRLKSYLAQAVREYGASQEVSRLAWHAWIQMDRVMHNQLSVPNAFTAMGGQILYTWDKGPHHFELEIFPDAPSEFFYLNRETDEDWDCIYNVDAPITGALIEKLSLFILHDL